MQEISKNKELTKDPAFQKFTGAKGDILNDLKNATPYGSGKKGGGGSGTNESKSSNDSALQAELDRQKQLTKQASDAFEQLKAEYGLFKRQAHDKEAKLNSEIHNLRQQLDTLESRYEVKWLDDILYWHMYKKRFYYKSEKRFYVFFFLIFVACFIGF